MLFESGPETARQTDHPAEPQTDHLAEPQTDHLAEDLAEPFGAPLAGAPLEEVHDLAAEPDDAGAPWGGGWGEFKDEAVHGEDGAAILAGADQDEGLEQINFGHITGEAAPGSPLAAAPGDEAVAAEPAKKKKRKREANPLVRILGVVFFGLLAVPCASYSRGTLESTWTSSPVGFL